MRLLIESSLPLNPAAAGGSVVRVYPVAVDKDIKTQLWFYRLAQFVLFSLYRILFDYKVYGTENVPEDSRAVIFAPNHASNLDPPIVGMTLKTPTHYYARDYLFKVFGLGTALTWLGTLPIKGDGTDFHSVRQMLRALKEGKRLVIFPEGTRSADGELHEAEGGTGFLAINSKAYVVPVYIQGTYEAYPRSAKFFRCKPVRVYFGKPFIPAEDPEVMAAADPYLATGRRIMAEIKRMKGSTTILSGKK